MSNKMLEIMGKNAKVASRELRTMSGNVRNKILQISSQALKENSILIIEQNKIDIENALNSGIKGAFIDRLTLNESRISVMAEGLIKVSNLSDPIGKILEDKTVENGLKIKKITVPLGVIGIIYESRPNVTADAFALCIKSGNALILRGGKESILSNKAIINCIHKALTENGFNPNFVQLITDISRETAEEMMKLKQYIDVLIPRGSSGLIQTVVEKSTIPVIETGVGNCHIYVDKTADLSITKPIIQNAKVQRPGVCNSVEKLLIDEQIPKNFTIEISQMLNSFNVEIFCDKTTFEVLSSNNIPAKIMSESDFTEEYDDLKICIFTVKGLDEAISHIEKYSSGHSDAIITSDTAIAEKFQAQVDSAAVYVNASTRFTDGEQFGYGAEMGISTQKLHARGPMGVSELTSYKYLVSGNGQIRS